MNFATSKYSTGFSGRQSANQAFGHALCMFLCIFVLSCDRTPATPRPKPALQIVATVYPLAAMAREIAGDMASVRFFFERGQLIPESASDPQYHNQILAADIVLSEGVMDSWASSKLLTPERAQFRVQLDQLPAGADPLRLGPRWMDPRVMREAAIALTELLAKDRPSERDGLIQRRDEFVRRLDASLGRYQSLRQSLPSPVIILSKDFLPLLSRVGIQTFELPTIGARFEDTHWMQLRALMQHNPRAIITSTDIPRAIADDLARRSGLPVIQLELLGTSSPAIGPSTYIEIMNFNLDQLTHVGPATRPQ